MSCTCREGYAGELCEVCAPGYYGNPREPGDSCRPCECHGNIDTSEEGCCDRITGECLLCLNNTYGSSCDICGPGFYGDAIVAKNCTSKFYCLIIRERKAKLISFVSIFSPQKTASAIHWEWTTVTEPTERVIAVRMSLDRNATVAKWIITVSIRVAVAKLVLAESHRIVRNVTIIPAIVVANPGYKDVNVMNACPAIGIIRPKDACVNFPKLHRNIFGIESPTESYL